MVLESPLNTKVMGMYLSLGLNREKRFTACRDRRALCANGATAARQMVAYWATGPRVQALGT